MLRRLLRGRCGSRCARARRSGSPGSRAASSRWPSSSPRSRSRSRSTRAGPPPGGRSRRPPCTGSGLVQRQRAARWFALAVQFAARACLRVASPRRRGGVFLANAAFLGMALDRARRRWRSSFVGRPPAASATRRRASASCSRRCFAWGARWWLGGGRDRERSASPAQPAASTRSIAWVGGIGGRRAGARRRAGCAGPRRVAVRRRAAGARASAAGGSSTSHAPRSPAMAWCVWPLAWLVHLRGLRGADARARGRFAARHAGACATCTSSRRSRSSRGSRGKRASGRAARRRDGTVWIACAAALPAIVYLLLVTRVPHEHGLAAARPRRRLRTRRGDARRRRPRGLVRRGERHLAGRPAAVALRAARQPARPRAARGAGGAVALVRRRGAG